MRKLAAIFVLALLGGFLGGHLTARAQTTVALQLTGNAPHTSCTVTASQTTYCFASDGLYWSNAGAAYVLVATPAVAGVTSVNGKTGVVVLGATATAPTVTLQ